jgi:hypothetical protein
MQIGTTLLMGTSPWIENIFLLAETSLPLEQYQRKLMTISQ